MQKTYYPTPDEIQRDWVVIDANGHNLGRLATQIAAILIGKHKPTYTPGVDMGDFVVVVNAGHIQVTGNKLEDKKYYRHTGYPGGIRETKLKDMLKKHPTRVIEKAVWGMVPHNKLGRKMMTKLKIYAVADHPHAAQNPTTMEL